MYTAIELSEYILSKCIRDDHMITNLHLQKILYYIQKDFLMHNDIAFSDAIEAWQFGPVVPEVYYYFCMYGAMPICNVYGEHNISGLDANIIDSIVEEKRDLDPWVMVKETHKKNGAWAQIFQDGRGNHKVIPIDLIKTAG